MTDTTTATASADSGTPATGTPVAAASADDGELTSLRSRNSGLNAKVTELQKQIDSLTDELGTARKGLTDKASADADLQKQLDSANATIEKLTRTTEVNAMQATYPEAFKELGEGIHGMKPETLASLEARLTGAKDGGQASPAAEPEETPRPVGNNQQRQAGGPKPIEDMTSDELRQSLRDMPRESFGLASDG